MMRFHLAGIGELPLLDGHGCEKKKFHITPKINRHWRSDRGGCTSMPIPEPSL